MAAAPTPLEGRQGLNRTMAAANTTLSPLPASSLAGAALAFLEDTDAGLMELQLLGTAMAIIYLGAHAALRRPPSARAPRGGRERRRDEDEAAARGLELSDAILLPVTAGAALVGMYKLIQWLQDPALLNKILRWYISAASLVCLATAYAHGLDLAVSLVFPGCWRAGDGSLRRVDQRTRTVARCDAVGNPLPQPPPPQTASPLPGRLALLTPSERLRGAAWDLRDLLTKEWALKVFLHGVGRDTTMFRFTHMTALFMALATTLVYFTTGWAPLSNLLGYGLSYSSFLVLSPTDFLTGSLVLCSLFVYDIVMVFYTPYMLTVATSLDVPIKLTFEAAERKSILGLGDIVVPGIVIGWALRLDLWIHYAGKMKREPVQLTVREDDAESGRVVERSETRHIEVKAPYVDAKGSWGERAWTARGIASLWRRPRDLPVEVAATRFRKTYFYASMAGYAAGMLCTLLMVLVFRNGQPALLYLVPGVLLSLLATSLARGEFGKLWAYTENGSLDTADVVVELDDDGRVVRTLGKLQDGKVDLTREAREAKDKAAEGEKGDEGDKEGDEEGHGKKHCVFSLSLEMPSDDEGEKE